MRQGIEEDNKITEDYPVNKGIWVTLPPWLPPLVVTWRWWVVPSLTCTTLQFAELFPYLSSLTEGRILQRAIPVTQLLNYIVSKDVCVFVYSAQCTEVVVRCSPSPGELIPLSVAVLNLNSSVKLKSNPLQIMVFCFLYLLYFKIMVLRQ